MNIKKISISLFLIGITFSISQAQNVFPNNGNVGVGTMNPNSKLEVNGKTELKGQLRVDSSAVFADSLKVLQKLTADKELVVEGDAFIKGKLELGDNATFKKDVEVFGDVTIDKFKTTLNGNGNGNQANIRNIIAVDTDGKLVKGAVLPPGWGNGGGPLNKPGCYEPLVGRVNTAYNNHYELCSSVGVIANEPAPAYQHFALGLSGAINFKDKLLVGVDGRNWTTYDISTIPQSLYVEGNSTLDGDVGVYGNLYAASIQSTNGTFTNQISASNFRTNNGSEFSFRNTNNLNPYFFIGVNRNNDNYVDIGGYDNGGGNFIPLILNRAGNAGVGIGTTCIPENTMLAVEGNIAAREVTVDADNWCDYVFEDDYNLRSLEDLQKYIDKEGHLPEVPTTAEVEEKGIKLGEMNEILLKKVEELTLYVLQQQKEIEELKSTVK